MLARVGSGMSRTHRSSQGCWTCRLRKKKCDETRPRCHVCTLLGVTCHFEGNKPVWMDGGHRQARMLAQVKREVRENAHQRPRRQITVRNDGLPLFSDTNTELQRANATQTGAGPSRSALASEEHASGNGHQVGQPSVLSTTDMSVTPEQAFDIKANDLIRMSRDERVATACFLEYVLPSLFAAYHPCIHEGGRAWVSELAADSSTVRNITHFQVSYCSTALRSSSDLKSLTIRAQQMSRSVLASAIVTTQVLITKPAQERIPGAIAVLMSILLVQHFGLANSIYDPRCDSLNVATKVYGHLLAQHGASPSPSTSISQDLVDALRAPAVTTMSHNMQFLDIEKAGLRFVVGRLLFDDIITSTFLGKSPCLLGHHEYLLNSCDTRPALELEPTVGCSSLVLMQISNISVLAEWKRERKPSTTLDVRDLTTRTESIKKSLDHHLTVLKEDLSEFPFEYSSCCKMSIHQQRLKSARDHIWTHAALLYLQVVAKGIQLGHTDVQGRITDMLEIIEANSYSTELLYSIAWPFCVSGCLASQMHQRRFTDISQGLHATPMSGSIRAAHDAMKFVWSKSIEASEGVKDFADVFRGQPDWSFLF